MSLAKSCVIRRATGPVRLACDDPAWSAADRLAVDEFPWYDGGKKQATQVALLYDRQCLYALFICEDRHIHAVETRPNGDVYLDSCVEMFIRPGTGTEGYFNLEANCCGTMHLGFGPGREGRRPAPPSVFNRICLTTSVPTATREETPADDGWWLAAAVPFDAVAELAGAEVAPAIGDVWEGNFYRCGGRTDPQYACWNPIRWEKPDYHRPECFGTLVFE